VFERPVEMSIKLVGAIQRHRRRAGTLAGQEQLPDWERPRSVADQRCQLCKVRYRNVYRGVDMIYYGNQRSLNTIL